MRGGVRLLHEFNIARERVAVLPIADVLKISVAVAVVSAGPQSSAVRIFLPVPQSSAVHVGIFLPVPQSSTVHVRIPAPTVCYDYRYGDRTGSTSIAVELSNPNGFCGGKDC